VGKGHAAEGSGTKYFARCRCAIGAKEEAGLRTEVGVAPAIQNDAGDMALDVKTHTGKHLGKLFTDLALVLAERSGKELGASSLALFFGGEARIGKKNFKREDDWLVGADRWRNSADQSFAADLKVVADAAAEPAAACDAELGEKFPVMQGDIG